MSNGKLGLWSGDSVVAIFLLSCISFVWRAWDKTLNPGG